MELFIFVGILIAAFYLANQDPKKEQPSGIGNFTPPEIMQASIETPPVSYDKKEAKDLEIEWLESENERLRQELEQLRDEKQKNN